MTNYVAIIEYGMGNVQSVLNAFTAIGAEARITSETEDLKNASGIVLPGVGAFPSGMQNLRDLKMIDTLNELVIEEKVPFLGICVGLQLLATLGHEEETCEGLGWIEGEVLRLPAEESGLKVPHIGWNDATIKTQDNLLGEIDEVKSYYFVHSFYLKPENEKEVVATCDYGIDFTCAIQKDNIFAVQFHAEKSQKHGLSVLRNFLTKVEEGRSACHA